jgi:hypothetical protein
MTLYLKNAKLGKRKGRRDLHLSDFVFRSEILRNQFV